MRRRVPGDDPSVGRGLLIVESPQVDEVGHVRGTPSIQMAQNSRRGFSLIELAMVLGTMSFISAIAIPRVTRAAQRAQETALSASTRNFKFAMELYMIEHGDRSPVQNADGSFVSDPAVIVARLTGKTDDQGTVSAAGAFGPYLKEWPVNPVNGKRTLRIGASAAGTHGWFLPASGGQIRPDKGPAHLVAVALVEGVEAELD